MFGVLWLTGGWFVRAVLQQVADSGRRPGTRTNPLKVLMQHTDITNTDVTRIRVKVPVT